MGVALAPECHVALQYWLNATPPDDVTIWPVAAQAAIDAIRAIDNTTGIIVPGNHYDGSWEFVTENPTLHEVTDPAGLMLFEAHGYFDHDASGTNLYYDTEVATPGESPPGVQTSPEIGVVRFSSTGNSFCEWLDLHRIPVHTKYLVRGIVTESGIPGNDDRWNVVLENTLDLLVERGLGFCIWANFPNASISPNSYNLCPQANGLQAPQLAVLNRYTGAPEPNLIQLTMPARMVAGAASSECVLTYRGNLASPITVSLQELGGHSFATSPAQIIIPAGRNPTAEFTITAQDSAIMRFLPAATGYVFANNFQAGITAEIDQQGSGAYIVSSAPDAFVNISTLPNMQSSTHRLTTTWSGPVVMLRRAYDSATKQFFATSDTDPRVDRTAIATWAGANNATIHRVITYDQSGQGAHNIATNSSADGSTNGGNEPLWVLDTGNGYPAERRSGSAIKGGFSSYPGGYGYTLIADFQYVSGAYLFPYTSSSWGSIGLTGGNPSTLAFCVHTGPLEADNKGPTLSVAHGLQTGAAHTYAYRFVAESTTGLQSWCDGALVASTDTTGHGPCIWDRYTCDEGWFRFSQASYPMAGDIRNVIVAQGALLDSELATIQQALAAVYATAWPSISPPQTGYPPIATVAANSTWRVAVNTPAQITHQFPIKDGMRSSPEALSIADPAAAGVITTITLSAANGTLSGPNLVQDSPTAYHIPSLSAAALNTALSGTGSTPGLLFTPTVDGATTTISATFASAAGGASASTSISVLGFTAVAETSLPAPTTIGTPIANMCGVNLSGGETNSPNSGDWYYNDYSHGGDYGSDYEYAYWASKGFGIIRVPLKQQRLQPYSYEPLDTPNVNALKTIIGNAAARGQRIILDNHNYGSSYTPYLANNNESPNADIAEGTATLIDFWTRVATKFKNYPNVIFDLMNEPHLLGTASWANVVAQLYTAIRSTGANQLILIEGAGNYSESDNWNTEQGTAFDAFLATNPTNIAFEPHGYLDDNSGGHYWVKAGRGAGMVASAITWARARGVKLFMGEFGWFYSDADVASHYPTGNSTPSGGTYGVPSQEGAALMEAMASASDVMIGWTFFEGGSSAYYNCRPISSSPAPPVTCCAPSYSNGVANADQPQVAILASNIIPYAGGLGIAPGW